MKIIITDQTERKSGKFYRWINSPIVISLFGALFVAWLTNSWERAEATAQLQRETLLVFADEYAKYLNAIPDQKGRELYIREKRRLAEDERDPYSDSRTFSETVKVYEANRKQLMSWRDPYSLTAQVRAAFSDELARRKAKSLDELTEKMDIIGNMDTFLKLHENAYFEYQELVENLGEIINE